jgi:hypothetical protein
MSSLNSAAMDTLELCSETTIARKIIVAKLRRVDDVRENTLSFDWTSARCEFLFSIVITLFSTYVINKLRD